MKTPKLRKGKSFAIIDRIRENKFYKMGFKAGQKQSEEEVLKLFEKYDFIDKEIYEKELKSKTYRGKNGK